jgi:protein arginine kinase activator
MNGKMCQLCQQKVAKIHITQIHNNHVQEFHICPDCGREHGISGPEVKATISISALASNLVPGEEAARMEPVEEVNACPNCGQTYRGFRESGRMGCWECYTAFDAALEPLLRKVQSGVRHIGKTPSGRPAPTDYVVPLIQVKREQLRIAISDEDFEAAARLRDEIRDLEGRPVS